MPRDKNKIHRSSSPVEEEILSDVEPLEREEPLEHEEENCDLNEERKKYLKNVILKRTLALKQQRELDRKRRVNMTK
jgi:hypothetical protein